jgi:hypothetical protein
MSDTRDREIAVARYIGYTYRRTTTRLEIVDPSGKLVGRIPHNGTTDQTNPGQTAYIWAELAPAFATDESLLSPLMKGLAGKGWALQMDVYAEEAFCLLVPANGSAPWENRRKGPTLSAAVFNCAVSLPEVQALINESTPS